jgi:predicted nucleic acid-binding protein
MPLVLDASVTISWCFAGEGSPLTESIYDQVIDDAATVPAVWPFEVANALTMGERRGRLASAQRLRFTALLRALPITVDGSDLARTLGSVVDLANALGLIAYDAAYLELALRTSLPLATQAYRMRAAAQRAGVAVVT